MDLNSLGAFLISLAVALVVAFPLGRALRARAWVFYLVAFVLVGAYAGLVVAGVNLNAWRMATFVLQKGYLSSVLLGIVMFTGCLDDTSVLKHRLRPIRGELSVLSFIFVLGHLAVFLPSYAPRLFAGAALKGNVTVSIVVALVLTAIFVALGVTSFRSVRRRMNPKAWKNLQRLSYVMVALCVVHVGFFLGGSAFGGSGKGIASFVVYALVVAVYAAARLLKAARDAKARKAGAQVVPTTPAAPAE